MQNMRGNQLNFYPHLQDIVNPAGGKGYIEWPQFFPQIATIPHV
jgi:hypothetical protein